MSPFMTYLAADVAAYQDSGHTQRTLRLKRNQPGLRTRLMMLARVLRAACLARPVTTPSRAFARVSPPYFALPATWVRGVCARG